MSLQIVSTKKEIAEAQAVLDKARCLMTEEQVEQAITNIVEELSVELATQNPLFVCMMNGGMYFMGRLLSKLRIPMQCDYIHATRYAGALQGEPELIWKVLPEKSLHKRVVVLVDDILDEGLTLSEAVNACVAQEAERVYTCVLVEKQHQRKQVDLQADFCALQVEDKYIFGCGMDYQGYWRNLPAIYALS